MIRINLAPPSTKKARPSLSSASGVNLGLVFGVVMPRIVDYDAVLAAQVRGIELIRDGASGGAIHTEVARTMEGRGYATGVVDGRQQGFFHGTGHGVGLDIHEPPRISRLDYELKTGQVVTVEPIVEFPEKKMHFRVEDTILVTDAGPENLSAGVGKEMADVEKLVGSAK